MSNVPFKRLTARASNRTIRLRAMWCSLSGLTWIILGFISDDILRLQMPALYYPGAMLLTIFVTIGFWRMNRYLHPFVDLIGKVTVNLALTYISPLILMMFIGEFVKYKYHITDATSAIAYILMVNFVIAIISIHLLVTINTSVAAINGEVYIYRWQINFFK
jgi:uncharacterized Tic20 family protein